MDRFTTLISLCLLSGALLLLQGTAFAGSAGSPRTLGLNRAYMETLIPGRNDFSGYRSMRDSEPSNIVLDAGGENPSGYLYSKIVRAWKATSGPVPVIRVDCTVNIDAANVRKWMDTRGRQVPPKPGSIFGSRIGDLCQSANFGQQAMLEFVVGRVFVTVSVFALSDADLLCEGLAYSMEHRLRQKRELFADAKFDAPPKVLVDGTESTTTKVLTYNDTTWSPVSLFKSLGAKVTTDQKSGATTITFGEHKLVVKPFQRELLVDGKPQKLAVPVVMGQGELVLPLKPVAEALGIKTKFEGKERILLTTPKKA